MTLKDWFLAATLSFAALTINGLRVPYWKFVAIFGALTAFCFTAWLLLKKPAAPKKHSEHYHSCGCGRRFCCVCPAVDAPHKTCPHCKGGSREDFRYWQSGEPT